MRSMNSQEFRSECTRKLAQLKPHATFLTVHNYQNVEKVGKIADWSIVFHISYRNALLRSIEIVKAFEPTPDYCRGKRFSYATLCCAKAELLASYYLSLNGVNYSPSADSYDGVVDAFGREIPGIKLHRKQDLLHLWGFVVHSRIIQNERAKPKDHNELTHARMDLMYRTPLSRWVQFRLEPNRFDKLVVSNLTIPDYEVIRQAFPSGNTLVKRG